jgi:hypothetical protein
MREPYCHGGGGNASAVPIFAGHFVAGLNWLRKELPENILSLLKSNGIMAEVRA